MAALLVVGLSKAIERLPFNKGWYHTNIPIGLIAFAVSAVRGSLWMVVDAYVLKLPHGFGTNTNVGIMEGVSLRVGLEPALTQFDHAFVIDDDMYACPRPVSRRSLEW